MKQQLIELLDIAVGDCNLTESEVKIVANYLIDNGVTIRERGEWKEVYQNKQATVYECSKCHHLSLGTSDYCICGADMRGKKDECL